MFTATTSTPHNLSTVRRRVGRAVVTALFAVMAALLLAAFLIPLLAGPGADQTRRPAPAPAPALPR